MILNERTDEYYMNQALQQAEAAAEVDEVPVGAIVVCEDRIIAKSHNLTERLNDVTAHAEMQAITAAANFLNGKYLNKCTMYVSLEPCVMCAGALAWAQLGKLVFGAYDERKGFSLLEPSVLHPKTEWTGGVLGDASAVLLRNFFESKRKPR